MGGQVILSGATVLEEFETRLVQPVRDGRAFVTEGLRPDSDEWDDPSTWEDECYDRYYTSESDGWSIMIAQPGSETGRQCADMQYLLAEDMNTVVPKYLNDLCGQGYTEVDPPDYMKAFLKRSHRFFQFVQTYGAVERPHTIAAFARDFEEEPCHDHDGSEWRLQVRNGLISEV